MMPVLALLVTDRLVHLATVDVAIANERHFEAGDRWHLSEKHRAKFAGADQADAYRLAGSDAGGEQRLQIHARTGFNLATYSAATLWARA